jgi:hypothetical protein
MAAAKGRSCTAIAHPPRQDLCHARRADAVVDIDNPCLVNSSGSIQRAGMAPAARSDTLLRRLASTAAPPPQSPSSACLNNLWCSSKPQAGYIQSRRTQSPQLKNRHDKGRSDSFFERLSVTNGWSLSDLQPQQGSTNFGSRLVCAGTAGLKAAAIIPCRFLR